MCIKCGNDFSGNGIVCHDCDPTFEVYGPLLNNETKVNEMSKEAATADPIPVLPGDRVKAGKEIIRHSLGGCDHHVRHPLFRSMVWTSNVQLFTEQVRCQWMIEWLAPILIEDLAGNEFITVLFGPGPTGEHGAKNSGLFRFEDGNGKILLESNIGYTDFPFREWGPEPLKFFYENAVLCFPEER